MLEISQIRLPLDYNAEDLTAAVAACLGLRSEEIQSVSLQKRAIDARKKSAVVFSCTVDVKVENESAALAGHRKELGQAQIKPDRECRTLQILRPRVPPPAERPVIVGSGPCGLFCGLVLARLGFRPILLERGKPAGPRARDVTGFWRRGLPFQADSNVQFGEGGAGTFSDGKLYTQIKDRENRIPWLLRELVNAGAPEDILVKARPHIGTDRLIKVVRAIREEILSLGGEVRFETRLERLALDADGAVCGAVLGSGELISTDTVVLAVGHSARETFPELQAQGVFMEAKPISIGVRIEHPQSLIDHTQYGKFAGHPKLGAAPYKFVHHCQKTGRAAYSFCMCPGGLVVAASSEAGGVVTNGMSSYARSEANANAGFMVDVSPADYGATPQNPLAGLEFQRRWERQAFAVGGGDYFAPIQRLEDFLRRRPSQRIGSVVPSYQPGVRPADLRACLPDYVVRTLLEAIPSIDQQLRGFALPEAILTGVETRSSSPVRLTRHAETLQSVSTPGLFPAGEGAGYAGGIISAAVDGLRVAEVLAQR